MKTRVMLMLAGLLFGQIGGAHAAGTRRALAAAATADRAQAAQLDAGQVIPICEKALVAAMTGRDALDVVKAETRAMPEAARQTVISICAVYLMGAVSAIKHATEAPKVPAGGTSI